jgi:hypothetical protein
MRVWYILSGLFIIIFICLIPLKRHFLEYRVQTQGEIINAQLTYVPHSVGCRIIYEAKFVYKGKEYLKKVGCNFDETHKVSDVIQLKHIKGTDIFLFPEESITKEFIAFGTLAAFGIFLIIYGTRKKSTAANNTVLAKKRQKN